MWEKIKLRILNLTDIAVEEALALKNAGLDDEFIKHHAHKSMQKSLDE